MKKITLFALSILIFTTSIAFAQSVKYPKRTGIVKEATMKTDSKGKSVNKPLAGVKIYIEPDAFNLSDANGTFTLTPKKTPFKITKVTKNNYTLLTPEEGTRTYGDTKDTLDVLMVSTKTLNNYMDSQMEIARLKREAKKNEELKKIEQQKAEGTITYGEYFQKQDSINQAYDEQMKRLVEFVEKSSKEFFKGMEKIDKEIDECIIKGEYDKADSLLLSKGYFNKRIENIEKLEQVTEQLVKDAVSDCRKYYEINRDKIKYDEALAYLDTARVLQEKHLGLQHPDLATTYHSMGFVNAEQGKLKEALKWYAKALNIREQVLNPLSPDLATSYNNIGVVYSSQKKYDKAMEFYYKALKIREQVLNPLSPALAVSYNSIGTVYSSKGDYDEALEWLNKALKIQEQVLHPLSPDLAMSYNNIGMVYKSKGDSDEALNWYDKALKIKEQVLNPLSPALAISYSNIGVVYWSKDDYDEALKFYDKALQIEEQVLNPLSPDLAVSYSNIGMVYLETGNYNKALEYFNKALPGYIKAYGEGNFEVIILKLLIKQCKKALGK